MELFGAVLLQELGAHEGNADEPLAERRVLGKHATLVYVGDGAVGHKCDIYAKEARDEVFESD